MTGRIRSTLPAVLILLSAVLILLCLGAYSARAEPYLAVQMGLKCGQCHVNPTGGGLRTTFGDVFAQTVLAAQHLDTGMDNWTGQLGPYLRAGGESLHRMIGALLGIRRFAASDTADVTDVSETFGWSPEPLGVRLEQAVREVVR